MRRTVSLTQERQILKSLQRCGESEMEAEEGSKISNKPPSLIEALINPEQVTVF